MAVAAYASVISLIHVLDHMQHPSMHRLSLNTKQIQTLHKKVSLLQEFLETMYSGKHNEGIVADDLIKQITKVAIEAEDIIDSLVVDRLRQEYEVESDTALSSVCQNMDKIIETLDSVKNELTMVKYGVTAAAGPSWLPSTGRNTMVGFDDHLIQVMDKLTGGRSQRQFITIVGMGGIGKTTLARNVFDDQLIVEHFHLRAWFTISQEYSVLEILSSLLREVGVVCDHVEDLPELKQRLYQSLSGRKYLIVMDDLWSTAAWDDLRFFFPDNGNGSRILVTTRLKDVAVSLGSHDPYLLDFLDEERSWNLLSQKAFSQGSCYPELEQIGKEIATSCRGLPLAIVVIGGLLAKSNMTREYWASIAENVISYANSENDEHCLKILALSYNHLPIHLKPSFLYLGVFPDDTDIKVSKLIKLWIAEGFSKPSGSKSMEEVAEEYLKDLIDRNLILIRKRGRTGKIKTCGIHDLLRDLCIKESHKEILFRVPKVQDPSWNLTREEGENACFLCRERATQEMIHLSQVHLDSRSASRVSCFVCDACKVMYPTLTELRLVRLHNAPSDKERQECFLQHTKLRYLSILWISELLSPSPIPLLWNLQSLIMYSRDVLPIVLPAEMWEMPQLRHIIVDHFYLPDPIVSEIENKDHFIVLENLHTLSAIGNFKCTKNILERIPNLKKLRIRCSYQSLRVDWSDKYSLGNFASLQKLESLFLECDTIVLKNIGFPHSLKKLSLSRCGLPWEDMNIIGLLPNLEVLKLSYNAFVGSEWNPVEGEFLRLKFLLLSRLDLVHWRAEHIPFPCLETLELRSMYYLKEIPTGFGQIGTLCLIHLVRTYKVYDMVIEIAEEQKSYGNESLQVYFTIDRGTYNVLTGKPFWLQFSVMSRIAFHNYVPSPSHWVGNSEAEPGKEHIDRVL